MSSSDRDLWFFYLEALGFTEAQVKGLFGPIDKFEKAAMALSPPTNRNLDSWMKRLKNRIKALWNLAVDR